MRRILPGYEEVAGTVCEGGNQEVWFEVYDEERR
jgi:hypothetical protein